MELIQINASPFDDPALRFLDDKIELHYMLASNREGVTSSPSLTYWPEGLVLPDNVAQLKELSFTELSSPSLWISKSRAGYGSHGNQIMTLSEACGEWERDEKTNQDEKDTVLLQRMIDPLLLLQGYKFSLRILSSIFLLLRCTFLPRVWSSWPPNHSFLRLLQLQIHGFT